MKMGRIIFPRYVVLHTTHSARLGLQASTGVSAAVRNVLSCPDRNEDFGLIPPPRLFHFGHSQLGGESYALKYPAPSRCKCYHLKPIYPHDLIKRRRGRVGIVVNDGAAHLDQP